MKRLRKVCGAPGEGCAMKKTNAVIDSLKRVFQWRSTTWWQSQHGRMMKEDPENRTRWKHKWRGEEGVVMYGKRWPLVGQVMKIRFLPGKKQNPPEDKYEFWANICGQTEKDCHR